MIAVSVLLGRVVVSLSEQILGRDLAYRAPYAAAAVDIAVLRGRVILLCRLQRNRLSRCTLNCGLRSFLTLQSRQKRRTAGPKGHPMPETDLQVQSELQAASRTAKSTSHHNPPLAAALVLLATVFIAATTLIAKALGTSALGEPLHPLQISQGRFVFAYVGISTVVLILRSKISAPHWKLHIGRSSLGWCGVTLMFASVAFIPLSDATAISFLNPVFGMLLAIPFLGERVGKWRWLAAVIALLGAMILLRPTPASFQPAALLAIGAAIALGAELIFIKKLAGREPALQVLWLNNLIGVVISSLAAAFVWQMPSAAQWAGLAALGGMMACAQACFINGMARADASFVAPFSYATLVFAALYDALIFRILPDWISILGAVVILSGAALLAWREAANGKKPSVTLRRPGI